MPKTKSKVELKRVNINLPIVLIRRVEEFSKKYGVNLTNAYIILLNSSLELSKLDKRI